MTATAPAMSASSAARTAQPAGDATNVVTDLAVLKGEARSPEAAFAAAITEGFRTAFETAQGAVKASDGATAEVSFTTRRPTRRSTSPRTGRWWRTRSARGIARHGAGAGVLEWRARCQLDPGKHGVPSVTIGAGQYEIHTIKEYVDLPEYERGCRLAVALATL